MHRLEKGLVMQPRAPSFAEDYIEETVAEFARLRAAAQLDAAEEKWAGDVLEDYFAVVTDTARIARARAAFVAIPTLAPEASGARSVRRRLIGAASSR